MNSRPGPPAAEDLPLHVTSVPSLSGPAMNGLDQALEVFVERVVRRVVREELAADRARPAAELATMATFAREHAISISTVRAMIRDGRLPAVKLGQAVRVRRDAQIGEPVIGANVPAGRARRILGAARAGRASTRADAR
jgi:excisionase family DNA binding protein